MNLEKTSKLALFVPEKLARSIKAIAALQGKSLSELGQEIFTDFIQKEMPDSLLDFRLKKQSGIYLNCFGEKMINQTKLLNLPDNEL
jgi:hypothetical protein